MLFLPCRVILRMLFGRHIQTIPGCPALCQAIDRGRAFFFNRPSALSAPVLLPAVSLRCRLPDCYIGAVDGRPAPCWYSFITSRRCAGVWCRFRHLWRFLQLKHSRRFELCAGSSSALVRALRCFELCAVASGLSGRSGLSGLSGRFALFCVVCVVLFLRWLSLAFAYVSLGCRLCFCVVFVYPLLLLAVCLLAVPLILYFFWPSC